MSLRKALKVFNPKSYKKAYKLLEKYGLRSGFGKIKDWVISQERIYQKWLIQNSPNQQTLDTQKETVFDYMPKISICVPAYNTNKLYLRQMIESVICQSYQNWELCIADASDSDQDTFSILEHYAKSDDRIKVKKLNNNGGISENTNAAMELATGKYYAFLDHDDIICPDALYEVVKALQEKKYGLIYTDQDFATEDLATFFSPFFKPDWSPDLLCSYNYISHLLVVKKKLADKVGWFRKEYDGSQDYDFVFRVTEKAKSIYHIPKILYHWRVCDTSVASESENKLYAYEAGKKAIESHIERIGLSAKVEMLERLGFYHVIYDTPGNPLVSIIIPNKDHIKDLKKSLLSLYNINNYKNFEIIICENNSEDLKTFEYYDYLKKTYSNINVVKYPGVFNYSAINNFAAKHASGDFYLFLNNDTEMINPDSLRDMLGVCMQDEVGIVGAKLLYENNTVQHAGVIIGFEKSAGHVFLQIPKDDPGYYMRPLVNCNYSAVTAACMMVKSNIFNKVKGFNEDFVVSLNDVDFCLKVRKLGKLVVYDAHSLWYHYESISRGYEDTPEKKARYKNEIALFQEIWWDTVSKGDIYYSPNFSVGYLPYKLHYDKAKIYYFIDGTRLFEKNGKQYATIAGWAVSKSKNKIKYRVFKDNEEIDYSLKIKARPDLLHLNFVDEADNDFGFSVTFEFKKSKKYIFMMVDGENQTKLKVSKRYLLNNKFGILLDDIYADWWEQNKPTQVLLNEQKQAEFKINPKISFVIPLFNTPVHYLNILVDSIKYQTYSNWELCLSDGGGKTSSLKDVLEKLSKQDKRIKYTSSIDQLQISENTNQAIEIATGDFIAFSDHDDKLAPNALFEIVKAINEDPYIEMLYTDEDKIDMEDKEHFAPHFKPDFNINLLRSGNYICHLHVIKRSLLDKVGLLNPECSGAQDFDFVLRCSENTDKIKHIPKILYHWRSHPLSTASSAGAKLWAYEAGQKALQNHYDRLGIKAKSCINKKFLGHYKTEYKTNNIYKISVVFIVDMQCKSKLNRFLKSYSICENTNLEFIVLNKNRELKPFLTKSFAKFNYEYHICDVFDKTNISEILNIGAVYSKNPYVLFTSICVLNENEDSLYSLCEQCQPSKIAATAPIIYNVINDVYSAGTVIDSHLEPQLAFNNFAFRQACMLDSRIVDNQNCSALSSKCMLVKKDIFMDNGGFDTQFKQDCFDSEFCVRLNNLGYFTMYTPFAKFVNTSKLKDINTTINHDDLTLFKKMCGKYNFKRDPYYGDNFIPGPKTFMLCEN